MWKNKILNYSLLPIFVCLSLLQVSGCITVSVQGESTGQMKKKVLESHFFKDAALFYPDEKLGDPEEIPPLKSKNILSLQHDLEDTLKDIFRFHKTHQQTLRSIFRDAVEGVPQATVIVTNNDLPEAQTTSSGEITIDVRVIQSMLRAALLNTYKVEVQLHRINTNSEISAHNFSPEEEKIAINTFLSKRSRFNKTPSRSLIGDLMKTDPLTPSSSGSYDWFEMNKLIEEFDDIALRYEVQRYFLLAHEVGHLVLGHFGPAPFLLTDKERDPEDDCAERRALERAADVYAGTLITLATHDYAMKDILGLFSRSKISDGFDTFFSYAYDYAGFKNTDGSQSCINYPPPEQRQTAVQLMYDEIRKGQIDNIFKNAKQGTRSKSQ